MPSESESLAREFRDDLTPEQIEEQEDNLMMCQAEENDAYDDYIESIEMQEPKVLDEDGKFWKRLHESGMIEYRLDESSIQEIRLMRFMLEAGIPLPPGALRSPLQFNPVIV
ncbi:hypothetical protein LG302_12675 [Halomonas organivorans]